ncbi:unnamed protein product [Ophioblennius macclurei]
MSFAANPAVVPDRDSLPLKKRDQRPSSPVQQQQQQHQQHQQQLQQHDAAHFKVPYPYKGLGECKAKHASPFQPVPRRVPALYQPWMQTHTSGRTKPHVISAFREHHGWAEWRDFSPLQSAWDFSHHYQHQRQLSHAAAAAVAPVVPPSSSSGHLQYPFKLGAISLVAEELHKVGGGYSWERALRDRSSNPERPSYARNKSPYSRRGERKAEFFPRIEKSSHLSLSPRLPQSPHEDLAVQHDLSLKSAKDYKQSAVGHCLARNAGDDSNTSRTSIKEDERPRSPSAEHLSSSDSPNRFPWLIPHFVAGSLIELRDGQLRRVEHLQTEDFLLGSLACPDLRLSCCTVQSISPSASAVAAASPAVSRLLILLHEQQSQELVDVYVEYPFFVRGRGWSSCSPERTARLCGLQCRQLSVGDVCLALTPVSAPQIAPSAAPERKASPKRPEGGRPALEPKPAQTPPCTHITAPPGQKLHSGRRKMGPEGLRRRHYSAPELRGPGTNCMK